MTPASLPIYSPEQKRSQGTPLQNTSSSLLEWGGIAMATPSAAMLHGCHEESSFIALCVSTMVLCLSQVLSHGANVHLSSFYVLYLGDLVPVMKNLKHVWWLPLVWEPSDWFLEHPPHGTFPSAKHRVSVSLITINSDLPLNKDGYCTNGHESLSIYYFHFFVCGRYMWVYMVYVLDYACVHMGMCAYPCGGQCLTMGSSLIILYFTFQAKVSMNIELRNSVRLAGQWASKTIMVCGYRCVLLHMAFTWMPRVWIQVPMPAPVNLLPEPSLQQFYFHLWYEKWCQLSCHVHSDHLGSLVETLLFILWLLNMADY